MQSNENDEDHSAVDDEQRLKAATYYTIKKMSKEVGEDMEVAFSPQVLASLNESLHRQVQTWTVDIENFAKHAKRTDVNNADVRLLARRNNDLLSHLDSIIDDMTAADTEAKHQKQSKTVKKIQKGSKKSTETENPDN